MRSVDATDTEKLEKSSGLEKSSKVIFSTSNGVFEPTRERTYNSKAGSFSDMSTTMHLGLNKLKRAKEDISTINSLLTQINQEVCKTTKIKNHKLTLFSD